jgi:hypothetical protein
MKRWLTTCVLIVLCGAPALADVRVTSTTSIEGGFAAMLGGLTPRMVMSIKGTKARMHMDLGPQTLITITDSASLQVIVLNPSEKSAQVMTLMAPGGDVPAGTAPLVMPKIEADLKPTGRLQTIAGNQCEEHALSIAVSMGNAAEMPAEAATALKDVRLAINGSMWVAKSGPGVAEFAAYQDAAVKGGFAKFMSSMPAVAGASGIEQLTNVFSRARGLPYLTEMLLTFEGSGPMVEFMKQQGAIKVVTKVTEVSTDPLSDDLFTVPSDYTVTK